MRSQHRGNAILAAATARDDPDLLNRLGRRIAIGNRAKELLFLARHRDREDRLQHHLPRVPARAGKPWPKQVGIVDGLNDVHASSLSLANFASNSAAWAATAVSRCLRSASHWASLSAWP